MINANEAKSINTPLIPAHPVAGVPAQVPLSANEKVAQWQHLQFGMFLHWGVYSMYEGFYNGEEQQLGYPEQIKAWMNIPDANYLDMAAQMTAEQWDADEWCLRAKNAGMTYLLITTKHHDGFCMWDTATTDFKITTQTPFGRDPLAELAAACQHHGMTLAFYYSIIDWTCHEAEPYANLNAINDDLVDYIETQLTELLSNYGPIAELWFDMGAPTPAQSQRLADHVHKLQPHIMVNSRVWNDRGDFEVGGDNDIPSVFQYGPWESVRSIFPASWSYSTSAKSPRNPNKIQTHVRETIRDLVTVISNGGQFVYNIGPTGKGSIDPYDQQVLDGVGQWFTRHAEAIHGARPTWMQAEGAWLTTAGNRLYVFPKKWEGRISIDGLTNAVICAQIEGIEEAVGSQTSAAVSSFQIRREGTTLHLDVLGKAPEQTQPVICLELDGEARYLPSQTLNLPQAAPDHPTTTVTGTAQNLILHRSAKGSGISAIDIILSAEESIASLEIRLKFPEGSTPDPTRLYSITLSDPPIIITSKALNGEPAPPDIVTGAELGNVRIHVRAGISENAAQRIRIEYANPTYYADELDTIPESIIIDAMTMEGFSATATCVMTENGPLPASERRIMKREPAQIPIICVHPTTCQVRSGSTGRLVAAADSNAYVIYQWWQRTPDGQETPLPGERKTYLEVEPGDNSYYVVAKSSAGSVQSQAAQVLEGNEDTLGAAPTLTPIAIDAIMGENITMSGDGANRTITLPTGTALMLSTSATGDPHPTLQWEVLPEGAAQWFPAPGQRAPTWTRVITTTDHGTKIRVTARNTVGTNSTGSVTLRITTADSSQ